MRTSSRVAQQMMAPRRANGNASVSEVYDPDPRITGSLVGSLLRRLESIGKPTQRKGRYEGSAWGTYCGSRKTRSLRDEVFL